MRSNRGKDGCSCRECGMHCTPLQLRDGCRGTGCWVALEFVIWVRSQGGFSQEGGSGSVSKGWMAVSIPHRQHPTLDSLC